MIPTFVQNVRKFPVLGNFVAFMSEMYRNSFNIVSGALRKMQSQNPYVRQIGARQLIGYTTTVGIATPVAMDSAMKMTGITQEMYQAYKDRFSADYEKTASMMPVTQQQEDRSWKASNLSYLVPYADVTAPFKAAMQTLAEGKDTDQSTALLFAKSMKAFVMRGIEYEKLQSNNYRILSEVYKDVQALRILNFTEKEIRDLLSGRRALSEKDVNNVLNGFFNPENIPNFKKDSAVANAIKQINRELGTDYKVDDFVDRESINRN
jgi:hypothetical protein